MNNKLTVVLNKSGLSCYLKSMFSYYTYCKKNNIKLEIIWIETSHCNGYFLDYFEKLDDVEFVKEPSADTKIIYARVGRGIDGYSYNDLYIFNDLKLKSDMKNIISSYITTLDKYIAIHIRRTDFTRLQKTSNIPKTNDEEFIKFIEDKLLLNNDYNIYLATDNIYTQKTFLERYPDKIKIITNIENNDNVRKTTLTQAIIDIYMCVFAEHFLGTNGSSFSDLINNFRFHNS